MKCHICKSMKMRCKKHFYIKLTEEQKESILRSIKESKEGKTITELELENRIKEKFGF